MPRKVERKTIVVCGNHDEYKEYLRRKVIPLDLAFQLKITPKYVYAKLDDLNFLHGIEIDSVVTFGSWRERRDLRALEEELQIIYNPNFKFPV